VAELKTRTCRNCGRPNPADARFCVHCSFSLEWETEQPSSVRESEETVIVEPTPEADRAGVYVGLSATSLSVVGGGTTACDVNMRNVGVAGDTYRLHVTGPAATFAQLSSSQVTLEPDERATILLSFAASQQTRPGTNVLDFDVRATSERDERIAATAHGSIEIVAPAPAEADRPMPTHVSVLLQLLGILAALAILQASFIDDRFFLNDFGGASHFRSKLALYLGQTVNGLPVVVLAATAAIGIAALRRGRYTQLVGSGLLLGAGAQAAGLSAAALANWSDARLGLALIGAVVLLAIGVWALLACSRGLELSTFADVERWIRIAAYAGVAASVIGTVIPFNTVTVAGSDTKFGATEVEGAAVFVGLAVAVVFMVVELPRLATAGVLLAVGIGTAMIWIRFAAVSRLEVTDVADPGYGAVIGLCGAIAIAAAGAAILAEDEPSRASKPLPSPQA
jgi:hypothetical protein